MRELYENKDYELVPGDDESWNVRFLTGTFIETVIQFGAIRMDGSGASEKDVGLSFDFKVMSSPDPDLTPKDEKLQEEATLALQGILETAIENKEEMFMEEVK